MINKSATEARGQIARIKNLATRILEDHDLTLGQKIREIFREQGVTITAILTAVGLAISTIVGFATRTVASVLPKPAPTPSPPSGGGVREWIEKTLKNLASVLKKLGIKVGAALPGIIGAVLTWVLNLLSKTVGFMSEHLWTLFLVAGGLLLAKTKNILS